MKNNSVIIKDSQIHNKGIFADKNFKKDETIIRWDISKYITKEEYDKLSEEQKDVVSILKGKYIIMQEPEKYMNHSCNANTIVKDFCDVAIRNIKKGEEITTDYSNDSPEIEMLCNCNDSKCRKIVEK